MDKIYSDLICPACKGGLDLSETEKPGPHHEMISCGACGMQYEIIEEIPVMNIKRDEESKGEGIAVDLENAISLFREEIDPGRPLSGRLFDEDLNKKDLVFLDIGCGIGRHLLVLRNNEIMNMMGFDLVIDLVRIARSDYGLTNLFVANALYIPLRDRSVDRCLLYNAIEHCSDPRRVLEEIHRVLREGGVLYMDVPNAWSMGDRIFRWGGILFYGKTSHIQKFTFRKIRRLVERVGFHIEKQETKRGIFIDYPQLKRFGIVKAVIKFLFGNEVSGWELKLRKKA